jgi:hypothetical protein
VVNLLTDGADWHKIALVAGIAVLLQMLLAVLGYWLRNLHMENLDGANMQEKNQVTKCLLRVDYDKLAGTELERQVIQHRDELSREGGILNKYLSILESFSGSVFGLAAAVVSLFPFAKSLFVSGGNSFVESAWFGAVVIAAAALAVWLLFLVKGKVAKENVALRDTAGKYYALWSAQAKYYQA